MQKQKAAFVSVSFISFRVCQKIEKSDEWKKKNLNQFRYVRMFTIVMLCCIKCRTHDHININWDYFEYESWKWRNFCKQDMTVDEDDYGR